MHHWLLLALYVLLKSANFTLASNGVSPGHQASYAAVPEVAIAAAGPSIIGADGPELTQVEAAQQQLGLTGRGVTLCVIDTGCDTTSSSFGEGCPHNDASSCRVAFGYDAESDSNNPAPHAGSPLALHGQHVANIALGGFPDKLTDAAGEELPQQRGVAPGARLGAIRMRALRRSVSKHCDINNLSVGGFHVLPNTAIRPGMRAAAAAGILTTAAAGNDDQAAVWGPRLFNVASPAAFTSAFAVAHVAGSASPGALLELDRPVMARAGPTTTLAAIQRADTPASLCHANPAAPCHTSANASTSSTQPAFPLDLHLMQLLNTADSQPLSAPPSRPPPPRCTLFRASDTSVVAGQVLVMQFDNDCKAFASDEEVWELLVGLQPALVLLVLPTDGDATATILYDRNKGLPVLWLQADAGAALVASLAAARQLAPVGIAVAGMPPNGAAPPPPPPADLGHSLGSTSSRRSGSRAMGKEPAAAAAAPKLLRWPSAALAPFPAAVAGQPAETSCLGPGFDLAIKPDIAAPGLAYSGLPGEGLYQVWPGTSQASPYIAGVLALWKEQMLTNRHTWWSGNASHDAGIVARAGDAGGSSYAPARARRRRLGGGAAAAGGEGGKAGSEPERAAAPSRIRKVRHRAAAAAGGGGDAPPGGWLAAAFTAIKNTARPVPIRPSSRLYWPPAKVGAGLVQAHAAVLTRVSISPFELLLRTDRPRQSQSHWLTVKNAGSQDVTYVLQHKPAVTISLAKAWYGRALDVGAATAEVTWSQGLVTVPAGSSVRVQVTLSIPAELQATDAFVSGYISFVPEAAADDADDAATPSGGGSALLSSSRQQPLSLHSPITLSVPYQGATRDYSTLGSSASLALFAPVLPQLDAAAAGVLARYPEIYVCESPSEAGCSYNKRDEPIIAVTRTAGTNTSMAVRFGVALLRPVKDVVVQVWSGDGTVLLGRSGSLGPAASAAPMKRSFLTEDPWDGRFTPADVVDDAGGGDAGSSSMAARLQPGQAYQLRLELWPVLAAGDRLAGRRQQSPFVYRVRGVVRVVGV